MSILRLLIAVVLIVIIGAFVMGYHSNRNSQQAIGLPDRSETSETDGRPACRALQRQRRQTPSPAPATVRLRSARKLARPRALSAPRSKKRH